MTNVNPTTNIRYGVIQGNNAQALMEEIYESGNDDSYDGYHDEKIKEIKSVMSECDVESLTAFIKEIPATMTPRALPNRSWKIRMAKPSVKKMLTRYLTN